jgi:hypothetical protein
MGLATVAVGCALVVADAGTVLLARALLGVVALPTLVLTEAVWWLRPWVARAVDAWAVTCIGAVVAFGLASAVRDSVDADGLLVFAAAALCFVLLPCTVVRWYVRDRAQRLGLTP